MKFYACAIGENTPDFVSGRIQGFLSWLYGKEVNWSHCGIEVADCAEDSGFWDSTGKGFSQGTMEDALDKGKSHMRQRIELDVISPIAACSWLRGCEGKSYSNAQYLTFFVVLLPFWMQALIKRFTPMVIKKRCRNGAGKLVCSEALARFIKHNCHRAKFDPRLAEDKLDDLDPFEAMEIARDYQVLNQPKKRR